MSDIITQWPHCDQRILHAPGECEYCDRRPEWQALRTSWGIAFTGHKPGEDAWVTMPCPADFNRPAGSPSDHRQWYGNTLNALPTPTWIKILGGRIWWKRRQH